MLRVHLSSFFFKDVLLLHLCLFDCSCVHKMPCMKHMGHRHTREASVYWYCDPCNACKLHANNWSRNDFHRPNHLFLLYYVLCGKCIRSVLKAASLSTEFADIRIKKFCQMRDTLIALCSNLKVMSSSLYIRHINRVYLRASLMIYTSIQRS